MADPDLVKELWRNADIKAGRIDPNNPYGTSSLFAPLLGFLLSPVVWLVKIVFWGVLSAFIGLPHLLLGFLFGRKRS